MKDKKESFTILIIDDEKEMLEMISDIISEEFENSRIFTANDGVNAIHKINNMQFDLVMTDLNMPRMSGKELLKHIKTVPKDFKPKNIMIISGLIESDILKDNKAGISLLKKPFTTEKLIKYVDIILNKNKERKSNQKTEKTKINVEYINPFIEATQKVLSITAGIESSKDFVFIKQDSKSLGDITGIITVNSDKYVGSLAISFTREVYLKLIYEMLAEEHEEIDEDNKDGVAEICNQIYGTAKPVLNQMGYQLEASFPTVVYGSNHSVSHALKGSILAVFFKTSLGDFTIECIIKEKSND